MPFAARNRVGVAFALLGALATMALGPAPAYAAATTPVVTLTGRLVLFADQTGLASAAIRTADKQLVPVEATAVKRFKSGSAITLSVVVPAKVRSVATANSTLTARGPNGKATSTPLDSGDLAAASDGTPEPVTSDLGRATVASAVSTGEALAVSAVVTAAAPLGSAAPALRRLYVAIVTPKSWPAANQVTQAEIQSQVDGASKYWSTVSSGGVTLDVAPNAPAYRSAYDCANYSGLFTEAAGRTGFSDAKDTSLVVVLPAGISQDATSNCSYGLGSVGDNVNDSGVLYVSDKVFPVLAHELGHNMSLQHADTLECPSASDSAHNGTSWTGTNCQEVQYGDGDDVMAASRPDYAPFLSAPQSLRIGLIPAEAAALISANGTTDVTLNVLGSRVGIRAAKIVDPTSNVNYYVEYRESTAPDTPHINAEALGVRVLRYNPASGTTVLLDPTPTATPSTDRDAALHVGGNFTSYSGAVHVTTLSTTAASATVSITLGATPPQVITPIAPVAAPLSVVQRYITGVYSDLFGRVPDAGGLAGWTAVLNRGTPRVAVANAITSSAEYRSKLITGSYAHYLGRTPDAGGLRSWLAAMGRGMTIAKMESGFMASSEYYVKAGSTNGGWVTKLYKDVLGRSAAPSEVNGWTTQLAHGKHRDQVAIGFLLSRERLTTVVNGYYEDLLGRGIDPSGARTWVGILQRGGRDEAIIGGVIASAEYYARPHLLSSLGALLVVGRGV